MIRKLSLVFYLLFASVFVLACSGTEDLEKAFEKMETLTSYTMETSINSAFMGNYKLITKVDGNKSETYDNINENRAYAEVDGNVIYLYMEDGFGGYDVEETMVDDYETDMFADIMDILDPAKFKKEKGDWVYNDEIYLDDEETVKIKEIIISLSKDGYVETMKIRMSVIGRSFSATIKYYDYNNTTVTIPK